MSWVYLGRRADKNKDILPRPLRGSLSVGFLYPASPRHMPVLTPSSWAPGKPPEIQVQCQKESKDLSRLVRLHIHHEKGSDDCIENRGSFFSCTPEFVDYLREPGHPGNGHSSAQDWGFKLAPPVMTKVYLLWALLPPFFSFPPFSPISLLLHFNASLVNKVSCLCVLIQFESLCILINKYPFTSILPSFFFLLTVIFLLFFLS